MVPQTSNPASQPEIEFRHVSLSFDDQPALVDVSFQLERGEMIMLTGKAAAGKSVLLRLAMGLLPADEGKIFVTGREIENLDESELLAVRKGMMGMVFHSPLMKELVALDPHDHSADPHYPDPSDKRRRPKRDIL